MNDFEEYFKAGEPGRRERAEARAAADDDVNHGRRAGEGLAKGVAHADSFPENRERGGDENGRIARGDEKSPGQNEQRASPNPPAEEETSEELFLRRSRSVGFRAHGGTFAYYFTAIALLMMMAG